MILTNDKQFSETRNELMSWTKRKVFDVYCQVCLGRINHAQIGEMRKSWMVADILKAWDYRKA